MVKIATATPLNSTGVCSRLRSRHCRHRSPAGHVPARSRLPIQALHRARRQAGRCGLPAVAPDPAPPDALPGADRRGRRARRAEEVQGPPRPMAASHTLAVLDPGDQRPRTASVSWKDHESPRPPSLTTRPSGLPSRRTARRARPEYRAGVSFAEQQPRHRTGTSSRTLAPSVSACRSLCSFCTGV
jgi:hypothetical protein